MECLLDLNASKSSWQLSLMCTLKSTVPTHIHVTETPGVGLLMYHSFSTVINVHIVSCNHELFLSHLLDSCSRRQENVMHVPMLSCKDSCTTQPSLPLPTLSPSFLPSLPPPFFPPSLSSSLLGISHTQLTPWAGQQREEPEKKTRWQDYRLPPRSLEVPEQLVGGGGRGSCCRPTTGGHQYSQEDVFSGPRSAINNLKNWGKGLLSVFSLVSHEG